MSDPKPRGRPFQKGNSANPGGRPKGTSMASIVHKVLDETPEGSQYTYRELVVRRMIHAAIKGSERAAEWLRRSTDPPAMSISKSGVDGPFEGGDIPETITVSFTA